MLEFRWDAFIYTIVNFLILVALLYRFLHKPLLNVLETRRKRIEDAQRDARQKAEAAAQAKREYERKLAAIEQERERMLAEARRHAERIREEALARAREEAERTLANMRAAWQGELRQSMAELHSTLVDTSLDAAGCILQKLTGEDVESRLHARLLERLDALVASEDGRAEQHTLHRAATPVRVVSARELPAPRREELAARVRRLAGEEIQVAFETDPALIAGARVEFDGLAVEATLADVLAAVRERLEREKAEADRRRAARQHAERSRAEPSVPPPLPPEAAETPQPADEGQGPEPEEGS